MRAMDRRSARPAIALAGIISVILAVADASGNIRVQNGVFVDDSCKEFIFSGYNAWQVLEMAANMCCGNQAALTTQFQEAARQSFNVVRIFGFPVQRGFNLQTSPGVYNEAAFVALDRVISEAGRAGLKLIIALTNNWNYNNVQTDWKCSYTNWTYGSAQQCDDFFSNRQAINLYKNHVKAVLTRKNTITGVTYGSDPTIFGWDLMNEPRSGKANGAAEIQSWITEVAPHAKWYAPQQLITVGEDGFYQSSNCQASSANPGGAWPYQTGQDFLPNHLVDGIDFASVHMWPDNWDRTDQAFGRAWLDAHMADAYYLGKPVVIEEFGKAVGMQGGWMAAVTETYANQYGYFKLAYDYGWGSLNAQAAYGYKGIMFWRWDSSGTAGSGFDDAATIETNSGVFRDIIGPYSRAVAAFLANPSRPTVPNCKRLDVNATAAPAPAPAALLAPARAPVLAPASAPALAVVQAAVAPAVAADAASGAAIITAAAAAPQPVPIVVASNITTGGAVQDTPVNPAAQPEAAAPAPAGNISYTWNSGAALVGTATGGRRLLQQRGRAYAAAGGSRPAGAALTISAEEPMASSWVFTSESTFTTPQGLNAYNVNYAVQCSSSG